MASEFIGSRSKLPLIVIVGPTGSGKTSLAVRLARKYGGEIICADSRTVYRGMDIGTAKPSLREQRTVPHWGIDLVDPGASSALHSLKIILIVKLKKLGAEAIYLFLWVVPVCMLMQLFLTLNLVMITTKTGVISCRK